MSSTFCRFEFGNEIDITPQVEALRAAGQTSVTVALKGAVETLRTRRDQRSPTPWITVPSKRLNVAQVRQVCKAIIE
jgi:hypothetical protein